MTVVPAAARTVLDFIGSKEAPHGYDTVYGNRMADMPKPITSMTVSAVIADGKRRTAKFGSSAAGRYQFMPPTLQSLIKEGVVRGSDLMSADVQDAMGYALLVRRGFSKYMARTITMTAFGLGLAQEWASFPVLRAIKGAHRQVSRGQSYYAGDGLNKALVSAADVEAVLKAILAGPALARAQEDLTPAAAPLALEAEAAPEVKYVTPTSVPNSLPFWAKWLGAGPAAVAPVASRPGLSPNGDAALWDVQDKLKTLGYEPILRDGLNGDRTRNAVRTARRRNGLPDGEEVDATFRAALPGLLPAMVSETRADAGTREMVQQSPDLFSAFQGLKLPGILGGTVTAIGAASDAGLMDKIKAGIDQGTDALGQVQAFISAVYGVGAWLYAHWWIPFGLLVLFVSAKAYIGWLKLKALWRQGRAS